MKRSSPRYRDSSTNPIDTFVAIHARSDPGVTRSDDQSTPARFASRKNESGRKAIHHHRFPVVVSRVTPDAFP
tara:strand:+ start:1781 stop:1999 length:219 start_codon:yes stop_codon:yes gene_type:complete